MTKTLDNRLLDALHSPSPGRELRVVVRQFAGEGGTREETYGALEALLMRLRAEGSSGEADEEALLDVMDALTGACHPQARLFAEGERA